MEKTCSASCSRASETSWPPSSVAAAALRRTLLGIASMGLAAYPLLPLSLDLGPPSQAVPSQHSLVDVMPYSSGVSAVTSVSIPVCGTEAA